MNLDMLVFLTAEQEVCLRKSLCFTNQVFEIMLLIVVISMSVASDCSSFVCGSSSSTITICRRANSNALTTIQTTSGGVLSLSLRSDSRLLAMGGKDGKYMPGV